jgi:HSP20 family molecular chaperone IbpA
MNLANRDSFFGDIFEDFGRSNGLMRSDIYEKDDNYFIEIDVPGFRKENVTMDYDDGYLKISGKREEATEENTNYLHRERYSGEFSRSYYIGNIEESKIKATFDNGTLRVTFPKEEPKSTAKQIPIE